MDWHAFFNTSDIRILLYLNQNIEARYSDLERKVVKTRSVLSESLRGLGERQLIARHVEPTKPIQTRYTLTENGKEIAGLLIALRTALKL